MYIQMLVYVWPNSLWCKPTFSYTRKQDGEEMKPKCANIQKRPFDLNYDRDNVCFHKEFCFGDRPHFLISERKMVKKWSKNSQKNGHVTLIFDFNNRRDYVGTHSFAEAGTKPGCQVRRVGQGISTPPCKKTLCCRNVNKKTKRHFIPGRGWTYDTL